MIRRQLARKGRRGKLERERPLRAQRLPGQRLPRGRARGGSARWDTERRQESPLRISDAGPAAL